MTAHPPPRKPPEQVADLEAARRRHGAEADRSVTMLTAGDPLADAVITELDLYGTQARQTLDAGLRDGLARLDERPPEAIAALLEQSETVPSWIDPLVLHRGDVVSLSVPPMWFGICSITSALAHTYASPAVAQLLARTGPPTAMAPHRLVETGLWARQIMRPGGLLHGAPGYVTTVQIRLLHARLRNTALDQGWDTSVRGRPISQADMARTWLGFTLVPFQALAAVGIDLSSEEEHYLYQYWSYIARLLGIDERLNRNVVDHADARRLQGLLDRTTGAPGDDSRALIAAVVAAQARAMAGAPGAVLTEEQVQDLIHSVLRQALGDEVGERLGIPAVSASTDLMPLISKLNRQARFWQTFSAASAGEARRRALEGPAPELIAAVLPGGLARQRSAGVDRSGAPAA